MSHRVLTADRFTCRALHSILPQTGCSAARFRLQRAAKISHLSNFTPAYLDQDARFNCTAPNSRYNTYPSLEGKVAVVTGGSRGIGKATVEALAENRVHVIACGRTRPDVVPDGVQWVTMDVSNADAVAELARWLEKEVGRVHVLVNNAGVCIEKSLLDTEDKEIDAILDVNCKGVTLMCKKLLPLLQSEQHDGVILNIGSISATLADGHMPIYNATKGYVEALTRSIAIDHGPAVRCNSVSPGWISTAMADTAFDMASDPDAARASALVRHPLARFGDPSDVARTVLFLASDQAQFITGTSLVVDGGLTAASPLQVDGCPLNPVVRASSTQR